MAGSQILAYASELRARLTALGVPAGPLNDLAAAATAIATAVDAAPGTLKAAQWTAARDGWLNARAAIEGRLVEVLLGPLAAVPGLAALADNLGAVAREGIHGELDLGPVHLTVASATLVVQPPVLDGGTVPEPLAVGPFPVGAIGAALTSPFGGGKGLPGGGSIVRLPGDGGYGGTLRLPLGPVQVSAAAVLAVVNGQPSFLAVLGVEFLPPIQLSFGFSLDRVGGIVGVNRRADTEALRDAVRTGTAGDVLFAVRPPASPLALVSAADRLFPRNPGTHLVGPSLKLSWLSFGPSGSLLSLDLAVIVELPTGKVILLGVARAGIPDLPAVMNIRLDVLGMVDPDAKLVSIDASLVDSHVLGIFEVYGDAALRFGWGSHGYTVVSIGGFYPGFNPEPARLPALRRVGLSLDNPVPIIEIRAEGYVAVTTNTIQFGGRLEVGISLGLEAHGFLQVDALVQFRPFHFEARISAGFEISAGGFSFASVGLSGTISGPGPVVIHGSLRISVFLFSLSWSETFTLGSGPPDTLPTPPQLLDVIEAEFRKPANVASADLTDREVVLAPRPGSGLVAAVPPTGALRVEQRRAPLGVLIERVDGRPLAKPQGVRVTTPGPDATDRFAPGTFANLTDAEALNRPPFDLLQSGRVLSLADPPRSSFPNTPDARTMKQIVIRGGIAHGAVEGMAFNLSHIAALTEAAGRPPALSDPSPMVSAVPEVWTVATAVGIDTFDSATAAHQFARYNASVAVAEGDAAAPVSLAGVL